MTPFVIELTDPQADLAAAGGKGANLRRLLAAGLPVPPGFVISSAAYRTVVEANDLPGKIASASAATDPARPESYEAASDTLRGAFARARLPEGLAEAIRAAYTALGAGAVAVRSSATAEDLPEASFAGQQETYLNVQGQAGVLRAVQRCWSSLWTARAMAYRARQGVAPEGVALAVVVQAMVPAAAAGVLFTVNPLTGADDEIVVNAAWGLGEALVAGQVNPDALVLDKASGRIKTVEVGDKAVMTAATAEGTAEREVPLERRQAQVLTPAQAVELARLAVQIESAFGAPQDIEWALAESDGRIYIVQSRPVTAIAPAASAGWNGPVPGDDAWPPLNTAPAQPSDHWTQADVGERWPEPVTPLTWSTWHELLNANMRRSLGYLKAPYLAEGEWARRAFGRFYFNEGLIKRVFVEDFGMPASLIAEGFGSQAGAGEANGKRDGWRWGTFLRQFPRFMAKGLAMNRDVATFEARFRQIDAWVDEFMTRELTGASDQDLWNDAHTLWWDRFLENMDLHSSVTSLSLTNLPMLAGMLRSVGLQDQTHALITGLTGIIQAEMVPALQAMAQQARSLGLADLLLENEAAQALAQLRRQPAAEPLLAAFDAFLQRHGHRCPLEAEWRVPRWREAPEQVLALVTDYLRAAENGQAQPADGQAQQRQREAATALVEQRLGPVRRALFRPLLARVQRLVRMRDNGQGYLVKLGLPIRHIYGLLAERWAARGWLPRADDFFFLVRPELEQVLAAGDPVAAGLDLGRIAAQRRMAYEHWLRVSAPEVLDAGGRPVVMTPAPPADARTLTGVPASSGQATGVARMLSHPREASRLQRGEILVTRATDPGWTPIFAVIGGLVLEVGGLLSHGAIVAREFGLPAVVNVAEATRRIRDGQTVTVDGSGGRVVLEEE
jgi:pyruvate,water dikinase